MTGSLKKRIRILDEKIPIKWQWEVIENLDAKAAGFLRAVQCVTWPHSDLSRLPSDYLPHLEIIVEAVAPCGLPITPHLCQEFLKFMAGCTSSPLREIYDEAAKENDNATRLTKADALIVQYEREVANEV